MIFFIPLFGALSDMGPGQDLCDRLVPAGARLSGFLALAAAIRAIFVTLVVLFGIIYAICYGPEAALFADLFDVRVRYTGISFVYQFSGIFASGITPIIATYLVEKNGGQPWYLCAYVVFAALISAACGAAIQSRASEPSRMPPTAARRAAA